MLQAIAGALDWPGWCRQGPNETDALAALLAYGPKYAMSDPGRPCPPTSTAGRRRGYGQMQAPGVQITCPDADRQQVLQQRQPWRKAPANGPPQRTDSR